MKVFVTGGAGYIGSHTCVALLEAGHQVVIYDNLCNANPRVLQRIEAITGQAPLFVEGDVRDEAKVEETLRTHKCEAVIHFAGLKAVGESVEKPLDYYDNNVVGSLRVLNAMKNAGVRFVIFSSSATVYGEPQFLPYTESHPRSAINPYGATKLAVEFMLHDFISSSPRFCAGILRYFNPVGAHPSGLIGEDPHGTPNNLMPYVAQVAAGRRAHLNVWGHDYDTPDGTGVRDYLHVVDLAIGHVKALDYLVAKQESVTVNLGTGRGQSVLDVVHAYERACGHPIACQMAPRRAGDLPSYYADATLAKTLLGWVAQKTLDEMCADSWRWQSQNPNGYDD